MREPFGDDCKNRAGLGVRAKFEHTGRRERAGRINQRKKERAGEARCTKRMRARSLSNLRARLFPSCFSQLYYTFANTITSAKSTSDSISARPMIIMIWMRPAAPGLRAAPSTAEAAMRD